MYVYIKFSYVLPSQDYLEAAFKKKKILKKKKKDYLKGGFIGLRHNINLKVSSSIHYINGP